jgi:prepilin-type N-terminal cleavage/methylation domain-containing protein
MQMNTTGHLRTPAARRGFTLVETALATIIVGVGVAATMQLFATCTRENRAAGQMSVAMLLASNVQEAMGGLSFADPGTQHLVFGPETGEALSSYDDIDDFDGATFNPPIDSLRVAQSDLDQYSQVVSVWPVYANKLNVNNDEASPDIPKSTYTGAVRVRVRILYRVTPSAVPSEVYRASWIRMDM